MVETEFDHYSQIIQQRLRCLEADRKGDLVMGASPVVSVSKVNKYEMWTLKTESLRMLMVSGSSIKKE